MRDKESADAGDAVIYTVVDSIEAGVVQVKILESSIHKSNEGKGWE